MIAWTLFAACSTGPTVTTETTVVGRLVDHEGTPMAGVEVNSIEGRHRTEGDGHFVVPIQPPSNLFHFVLDGVFYQRVQRPADLGTSIEVVLPERAARKLGCPPIACDLSLAWRFDSTLSGKLIPTCEPGNTVELAALPTDIPTVSCREGRGRDAVDHPMTIDASGDTWTIREAGADVTVEILDAEGNPAPDCEVRIGRNTITADAEGAFVGRAHGPTTISATCAGRPAEPLRYEPVPEVENRATLRWLSDGATVDIGAVAPWAKRVVVRSDASAWEYSAAVDESGVLALPPLPAGTYTVYLRGATGQIRTESVEPITAPDVLSFRASESEFWVGRLRLEEELSSGELRTHVAPPR